MSGIAVPKVGGLAMRIVLMGIFSIMLKSANRMTEDDL